MNIHGIEAEIIRKRMKNMYIHVKPDGRVVVTAPTHMQSATIEQFVTERAGWIRARQAECAAQPAIIYESGERHTVWGKRYPLTTGRGKAGVTLQDGKLHVVTRADDAAHRKAALDEWRREQVYAAALPLIEKWCAVLGERLPTLSERLPTLSVRKMKSRWGSCNAQKQHVTLNLYLSKKDPLCLEYVVVHELVHLQERGHGQRFKAAMDRLLPGWRDIRALMNQDPWELTGEQ